MAERDIADDPNISLRKPHSHSSKMVGGSERLLCSGFSVDVAVVVDRAVGESWSARASWRMRFLTK
ncbi:hypothetical protein BH11PAT4_BH11PAT4_8380 [soil metagenome]